ncbi:hypothetical protein JCM4814A_01370 [Streptomyces phaeofaciens JCM 4814]|uniref:Uncharacterized protein n=1 Tax=Streptomyces phaeofaciens TaxID=68254 RepID=A0A918HQH1_9ACTN|nr:hypothetical protein GCM10010226_85200 [Streptomyces phaeofaciens]
MRRHTWTLGGPGALGTPSAEFRGYGAVASGKDTPTRSNLRLGRVRKVLGALVCSWCVVTS